MGSGDAVLKLLRNQEVVNAFKFVTNSARAGSKGIGTQFGFTLRFGTVPSTVAYPTVQWDVCRVLTGAPARHALTPACNPTLTVSPFQVLRDAPLVLSVSHWQSVAFETWKPKVIHSPLP